MIVRVTPGQPASRRTEGASVRIHTLYKHTHTVQHTHICYPETHTLQWVRGRAACDWIAGLSSVGGLGGLVLDQPLPRTARRPNDCLFCKIGRFWSVLDSDRRFFGTLPHLFNAVMFLHFAEMCEAVILHHIKKDRYHTKSELSLHQYNI